MTALGYRIRLVEGERQFEAEGDKEFVLEMLSQFKAGELAPAQAVQLKVTTPTAGANAGPEATVKKKLAVGEFVRALKYRKHTDIVLAFGYYLEKHANLSDFTPADINNCYYEAKIDQSNTSQMIALNMRSGRMMPAKATEKGKRRRYTLTQTGEEKVEADLKAEIGD